MKCLHLVAVYGDIRKNVSITHYWGDSYYVFIENKMFGIVTKYNGQWTRNTSSVDTTIDDIQILGALIEEGFKI